VQLTAVSGGESGPAVFAVRRLFLSIALFLFLVSPALYAQTEPSAVPDGPGTAVSGELSPQWTPSWVVREEPRFRISVVALVLSSVAVLCALGLFVAARGIGAAVSESSLLRLDAAALVASGRMPPEKRKKQALSVKRRGTGLRLKLASFTIMLVLAVVVMISTPLYVMMTRSQQQTLLRGLWERSIVLLEGVAANARAYLPAQSVQELSLVPSQMYAVPEARFITITGRGPGAAVFEDRVWATNDPDILEKIDTFEFQPGVSRITDVLSPRLQEMASELNRQARYEIGGISLVIAALTHQALLLEPETSVESLRRMGEIQAQIPALQTRIGETLAAMSRNVGSQPHFSLENFTASADHRYIFFKPVMFRGAEDVYFQGLVRLEVSVTSILDEIEAGRLAIIRVVLLVALIAQIVGAAGALLLSTLIIRPIRQLVSHVEVIRDTEDKTTLGDVDIRLKSYDELAILGDTINDMTRGLVKAAIAASDLSMGKEVQKKFIPLELDGEGNKLSYGSKDTGSLTFFGYYEGAKGVSGDYFDYLDLDGRYYAVIKCDVAGKGIPAALIMIQVATMFLNYFKQWTASMKNMHIEALVYQINGFFETLGFEGRFAAFTLCLYDSQTGVVRFCNAGDNIVYYFDASAGRVKTVTLPQTPATGVIPNSLVESKGGYPVQIVTLDRGDILLLFTDGIEEAKRKFRNAAFEEIVCREGKRDSPHENHVVGQADEELSPERLRAIINAVMNKQVYTLHKWHNPEGDGNDLRFDFSSCQGSVEEVVKAMVSVEKVFRCYKNPNATGDNRIQVEKTIDAFLGKHFLQYRRYCSSAHEDPSNPAYIYYTHINEDEQYDDLTILGIKRK